MREHLVEDTPIGKAEHHQGSVQSVRRAMRLLKAFGPMQDELGVTELSRITGLHKTTVYRLLVTLDEEGFIEHGSSSDKYRLGPALIHLGRIVLDNIDVGKQALPQMRALVEDVGETAMLEIWDDGRTLVVAKVDGQRFSHVIARASYHLPAHASAGGKAILAFLPHDEIDRVMARGLKQYTENTITDPRLLLEELTRVRVTLVSYDRQEIDIGICAISAPVFDHRGKIAGALSVAGPAQRIQLDEAGVLVQRIKGTAEAISRRLGYGPHR